MKVQAIEGINYVLCYILITAEVGQFAGFWPKCCKIYGLRGSRGCIRYSWGDRSMKCSSRVANLLGAV